MRRTITDRTTIALALALCSISVAAQSSPTAPIDSDVQAAHSLPQAEFGLRPFGAARAAPSDEGFRAVRHDVLVDVPRGEAIFNLWLSEAPDFFQTDEFGRQSHSFQYFVNTPDFLSFYSRAGGTERFQPLFVLRGEEIHHNGTVVAREVVPFYDASADPSSGGWGPTVATMPLQHDRKRVSFRLPLSVFGDDRAARPAFALHYFLELYQFGGWTGVTLQASAKVARLDATIDVAPHHPNKAISPKQQSPVAVHVLTVASQRFFAEDVDVTTVRLGPVYARPRSSRLFDVDHDGYKDLILTFNAADLGLSCVDSDVRLTGEIVGGMLNGRNLFVGVDTIRVAGCQ